MYILPTVMIYCEGFVSVVLGGNFTRGKSCHFCQVVIIGDKFSVVLVWLHIIRFSFSKKANEEQSLILVLVSQLKRKKGY